MPFVIYPMTRGPLSRFSDLLRRFALILALASTVAVWTSAGDSAAAAEDVFTVGGIAVDETAATATAARSVAFRRGQRAAMTALLKRLTRRADHGRLPPVDNERLNFMVQALEVADEKTSNVRYLANMTVAFKPGEVRRLLREARIPFAETASKPVLVLPVMQQGGAPVLWEEPNLWRQAWSRLQSTNNLVPLIVPVGDLNDIVDVDARQAAEGDPLRLAAIASRYGAGDVLVAIATLTDTGEVIRIDIAANRIGSPTQASVLLSMQSADPLTVPELLRGAAGDVAAAVEDSWKAANIIEYDRPGRMIVAVPLASLEQWVSVERRLNNVASISEVSVISLTRDSAEIEIIHFGDEAQLATTLAQQDLALEQPAAVAAASDPFRSVQTNEALRIRVLRPITP